MGVGASPLEVKIPTSRKVREKWGTHCVADASKIKAWTSQRKSNQGIDGRKAKYSLVVPSPVSPSTNARP
jgi:hypothetical protein